jgi:hypothetical protein
MPGAEFLSKDPRSLSRGIESQPLQIGVDHDPDQLREGDSGRPLEDLAGLGRVRPEMVDFERAPVPRIESDVPFPGDCRVSERLLDEIADRMGLSGSQHIVRGSGLLEHRPHPFDVLGRISPVSPSVEVSQIEDLLPARLRPYDSR